MLVDSAQAFKRKGGGGGFTDGSQRSYCIQHFFLKKQVIPQTGLSLCFELQRMFTTIKSNIVGNANYKKEKKRKRLQKNICLIILMHIVCCGTVGVN